MFYLNTPNYFKLFFWRIWWRGWSYRKL